jgi:hypothetical protein
VFDSVLEDFDQLEGGSCSSRLPRLKHATQGPAMGEGFLRPNLDMTTFNIHMREKRPRQRQRQSLCMNHPIWITCVYTQVERLLCVCSSADH